MLQVRFFPYLSFEFVLKISIDFCFRGSLLLFIICSLFFLTKLISFLSDVRCGRFTHKHVWVQPDDQFIFQTQRRDKPLYEDNTRCSVRTYLYLYHITARMIRVTICQLHSVNLIYYKCTIIEGIIKGDIFYILPMYTVPRSVTLRGETAPKSGSRATRWQ